MATQAYRDWVTRGRRWTPARPIADLVTWANANGVRVLGTIGNEDHLQADIPQDHTPFSSTAWPAPLPGYVVTAADLENVRLLGEKIEAAGRRGELPWLKYMNHSGRHINWKGRDWARPAVSSSRDHHVHLSIRTDWCERTIGRFDPWNRGGEDVELTDAVPVVNDERVKHVVGGQLVDELPLGRHLAQTNYYAIHAAQSSSGTASTVNRIAAKVDELAARPAAVALTDADRDAIAEKVVTLLASRFELGFREAS